MVIGTLAFNLMEKPILEGGKELSQRVSDGEHSRQREQLKFLWWEHLWFVQRTARRPVCWSGGSMRGLSKRGDERGNRDTWGFRLNVTS